MSSSGGPRLVKDGMVFGYDTGYGVVNNVSNSRFNRGKPAVNFFTNGNFSNGTGITQEAGSNPTNTIIALRNPGATPYVLRQSGNNAEYQINLSTQLVSNTTYCMSGWFAKSPDYNGAETMFHSRATSSSGAHVSLGTGIGTVLATKRVGGLTWKFCYATITTPSDYSNTFNWYLGYGQTTHTGYRYYTNIQMEVGSLPSPFVNGTRSSTQGVLDLKKTTSIDVANVSFNTDGLPTFDGTNDFILTGLFSGRNPATQPFTVEAIVKSNTTSGARMWVDVDGNGTNQRFYSSINTAARADFGTQASSWASGVPVDTNYHHQVIVMDGNTVRVYDKGVQVHTRAYTSYTLPANIRIGSRSTTDYFWNGEIPVFKLYGRALTPSEILTNYRAYKKRFNL